ncbi:hypothetical protein HRbin15_01436 [bacterium HR15]|nr:hypothetical protein HRbin15_01436 [bacterium HR15]
MEQLSCQTAPERDGGFRVEACVLSPKVYALCLLALGIQSFLNLRPHHWKTAPLTRVLTDLKRMDERF